MNTLSDQLEELTNGLPPAASPYVETLREAAKQVRIGQDAMVHLRALVESPCEETLAAAEDFLREVDG